MRRLLFLPFYPFLMALAIPLGLYTPNLAIFVPQDVLRALVVFLAVTLALFLLLWLATRRPHLAGLLTGLLLLAVWAPGLHDLATLALVAAPFGLALLVHAGGRRAGASLIVNLFMLAFLAAPTYALISGLTWQARHAEGRLAGSPFEAPLKSPAPAQAELPTIVHIVLDGYAGDAVLRDVIGVDNRPFSAALENLGFRVAPHAHTPYNQTFLALASIFGGRYLDAKAPPFTIADDSWFRIALSNIVVNGPLRRALRRLGYRFVFTRTEMSIYRYDAADTLSAPAGARGRLNLFERFLVGHTSLRWLAPWLAGGDAAATHAAMLAHAFTADHLAAGSGPRFLFQHVLAPHPPFVVDRDGRPTARWSPAFASGEDGDVVTLGRPELQRLYREGYAEKLAYANRAVLAEVRRLIAETQRPLVIVIHGDHGAGSLYYQDDAAKTCLYERFHPYLAVYASDPALRRALAPVVAGPFNLVNLYRLLLAPLFAEPPALLDDRSAFSPWSTPRKLQPLPPDALERPCPL